MKDMDAQFCVFFLLFFGQKRDVAGMLKNMDARRHSNEKLVLESLKRDPNDFMGEKKNITNTRERKTKGSREVSKGSREVEVSKRR